MRFADLDGSMIDVYQAATQMTDESGQTYPFTIDTLLDRAIGARGLLRRLHREHAHRRRRRRPGSTAIVASAQARGVPVVSARQMLDVARRPQRLVVRRPDLERRRADLRIAIGAGANGLQAMLPTQGGGSPLTGLTRDGVAVPYTTETIKGVAYAVFTAQPGTHQVSYGVVLHTLTVTPPTHGTITGTGISCGTGGSDCTEAYSDGTEVPLTATPDTGYDFGGWTGDCTGTGACSVSMTAARTVGASFALHVPPTVNVVWTHDVGVSVVGNSLTKVLGESWDAGAVSTKGIASGDGFVEFDATATSGSWMAGLGKGDESRSFTDIEYAVFLHSDGGLHVYEGGTYRGYFGSYAVGTASGWGSRRGWSGTGGTGRCSSRARPEWARNSTR